MDIQRRIGGHACRKSSYWWFKTLQPDNSFFNRTLGRLLEQDGRLSEALTQYELAAEKDPESDFYANLVETTRARLAK